MKRPLCLCLMLVSFSLFAAPHEQAIDRLFADYDKPDVPGAAVTVIQDGNVLFEKGYGLANLEEKTPATPGTNFRLASLTKQFTAMAVMILVERGKLRLDETLPEIFPEFPSYGKRITIRHLLNHQSGLVDYEDLIPSSQTEQVSDEDVLHLYEREGETSFTPGTRYRYCNGGYVLLGLAVERASGRRFSDFLRENVFAPLEMSATVMFEKGETEVSHRAYGYTYSAGRFRRTDQSTTSATRGDGGVYTSVMDLFRWDQALYGSALVSAEMLKQAFTHGVLSDGTKTSYGFGWEVDTYHGMRRLSHTGSTIGFRTAIQRFPEKRFTVAVLVNRADVAPWDTARRIADLFLDSRR